MDENLKEIAKTAQELTDKDWNLTDFEALTVASNLHTRLLQLELSKQLLSEMKRQNEFLAKAFGS